MIFTEREVKAMSIVLLRLIEAYQQLEVEHCRINIASPTLSTNASDSQTHSASPDHMRLNSESNVALSPIYPTDSNALTQQSKTASPSLDTKIQTPSPTLDVDFDTMTSFYNQLCLRFWRQNSYRLHDDHIPALLHRLTETRVDIITLAKEYKCSSYRISKLMLERLPKVSNKTLSVSDFLADVSVVKDIWLRKQLVKGILEDLLCSPYQDQLKECVGKEYEALLVELLEEKHIVFETEADLRSKGKSKTPDILLLVPMTIRVELRNSSGDVIKEIISPAINWIDSKALFAVDFTFEEHKEQFQGYINRYGCGMVIYWHGFSESVLSRFDEKSLVISDHFPDEWIFPTGEIADGRPPSFIANISSIKPSSSSSVDLITEGLTNRRLFEDE